MKYMNKYMNMKIKYMNKFLGFKISHFNSKLSRVCSLSVGLAFSMAQKRAKSVGPTDIKKKGVAGALPNVALLRCGAYNSTSRPTFPTVNLSSLGS